MSSPPNPAGQERRRHRRFGCEGSAEVVVRHASMLFRGWIRDISRSGCFIESRAHMKLERLQEVELQFSSRGTHVSSRARAMEIRPGVGVGFEFICDDAGLHRSLTKLIGSLDGASDPGGPSAARPIRWKSEAAGTRP